MNDLSHHDAQRVLAAAQAEVDRTGRGAAVAVVPGVPALTWVLVPALSAAGAAFGLLRFRDAGWCHVRTFNLRESSLCKLVDSSGVLGA